MNMRIEERGENITTATQLGTPVKMLKYVVRGFQFLFLEEVVAFVEEGFADEVGLGVVDGVVALDAGELVVADEGLTEVVRVLEALAPPFWYSTSASSILSASLYASKA